MYEWLPVFLGEEIPSYSNYSNLVTPSVTVTFEAAAFRIGHSHIAPAVFARSVLLYKSLNFAWHSVMLKYSLVCLHSGIVSATSTPAFVSATPTSAHRSPQFWPPIQWRHEKSINYSKHFRKSLRRWVRKTSFAEWRHRSQRGKTTWSWTTSEVKFVYF